MNPLIRVTEVQMNAEPVACCDARELHAFLEVSTVFANWIARRIDDFGFEEGRDYVVFEQSVNGLIYRDKFDLPKMADQTTRGGDRRSRTYAISLDMAKELAMVERNWRGKQARQYFIECERRMRERVAAPLDLRNPGELLQLAERLAREQALLISERNDARAQLKAQAPKVAAFDRFLDADGLTNLQNAARALGQGPNKFVRWLKTWALFYQGKSLVARAEYVQRGWFEMRTVTVGEHLLCQTFVTPRGLAALSTRLDRDGLSTTKAA